MKKRYPYPNFGKFVFPIFLIIFSVLVLPYACTAVTDNSTETQSAESFPMQRMLEIEKSIKEPKFRDVSYNIVNYGAVADGKTMSTAGIRKAILACSQDGGGKVIVPAGKFLTGPIHLENNVNLHLMEGAEILFSTNPDDFYPLVHTSFEGMELMNYSPLIYAKNKKNIAVTGKGILNGQASNDNWWTWKGSSAYGFKPGMPSQLDPNNLPKLMEMADTNVPVSQRTFGNGRYLRPNFIEPFECENVLIQGITIINAPFWILHPIKSKNIIVDGVNIRSHGPNNDGCDPEYSQNVLIKNSIFNTGDDCIAIKAGRDEEGRRVGIMTENVIVRDCKMIDGHGGVVIGSEMSAGVRNVFVYNNHMDSPELDRAIRLKTNNVRGGVVDGVFVKNLTVGEVKEAVLHITMNYKDYKNRTGNFTPQIRNILLEDVKVKNGGKYAIFADGLENSKIQNITFKNVTIDKVKANFNVKSVENLKLINTKINGAQTEYTPN